VTDGPEPGYVGSEWYQLHSISSCASCDSILQLSTHHVDRADQETTGVSSAAVMYRSS
jgi:hypothetical protein